MAQNSDDTPVIEEFKMDEPSTWQKWAHAIMYVSPAILWTVNGAIGVQQMVRHASTKDVSQESIDQYTCSDGTVVSSFWGDQHCDPTYHHGAAFTTRTLQLTATN